MITWPEVLVHAEDWANGFWTGAAAASIIGIVAAAVVVVRLDTSPGGRSRVLPCVFGNQRAFKLGEDHKAANPMRFGRYFCSAITVVLHWRSSANRAQLAERVNRLMSR